MRIFRRRMRSLLRERQRIHRGAASRQHLLVFHEFLLVNFVYHLFAEIGHVSLVKRDWRLPGDKVSKFACEHTTVASVELLRYILNICFF